MKTDNQPKVKLTVSATLDLEQVAMLTIILAEAQADRANSPQLERVEELSRVIISGMGLDPEFAAKLMETAAK